MDRKGADGRSSKWHFLVPRRGRSVFWEYVLVCTLLITLTSLLLGVVLGRSYLRTFDEHQRQTLQKQADIAAQSLNAQMDTMRELAAKLSIQSVFRHSYINQRKFNKISVAEALSQYQSYSALSDCFALIYEEEQEAPICFLSDGHTSDLDVFLERYHLAMLDDTEIRSFLFQQTETRRVLKQSDCILFAFTVHGSTVSAADEHGTLLFVVRTADLQRWLFQISGLQEGSYALSWQTQPLLPELPSEKEQVLAGETSGWQICIGLSPITLSALLTSTEDILRLAGCILLLIVLTLSLAWFCYSPIFKMTTRYAQGRGNEFQLLNDTLESFQCRTELLHRESEQQRRLLSNYTLLMLLNGTAQASEADKHMEQLGIDFPYPCFEVILVAPAANQVITEENIQTLLSSIPDTAGDDAVLYAVDCVPDEHILALLCNYQEDAQNGLLRRLHTYLNRLPRRFHIVEGSVTNACGISASYLTAEAKLKMLMSLPQDCTAAAGDQMEPAQLAAQLIQALELGDCQRALLTLEQHMAALRNNGSELFCRYAVMNLVSGLQRLCVQYNYKLSDTQLSMLLPTNNLQAVHYELLQLIPILCAQISEFNGKAIHSTDRLVMEYLQAHFCDYDISVQTIAESVGIGINRCYAIIKEETGHSLKTILTKMRVERAKELLKDNTLSVSEISGQLGYGSASYFIRVFKQAVGQPPDSYRRASQPGADPEDVGAFPEDD